MPWATGLVQCICIMPRICFGAGNLPAVFTVELSGSENSPSCARAFSFPLSVKSCCCFAEGGKDCLSHAPVLSLTSLFSTVLDDVPVVAVVFRWFQNKFEKRSSVCSSLHIKHCVYSDISFP